MKTTLTDPARLKTLLSGDVAAYLRTRNWKRTAVQAGEYAIWISPAAEAEILIPLDTRFADYALRLSEALKTLSSVEQRAQTALAEDILSVNQL